MAVCRQRYLAPIILLLGYGVLSLAAGVFLAEATLHPARRPLPAQSESLVQDYLGQFSSGGIEDISITAQDGTVLRGWTVQPQNSNGNAVILLHGMSDNRLGMIGYAKILLQHGYLVLMPDARAHGASGGALATYGLLERDDIRTWFDWIVSSSHPRCIYGFAESMGASQLLESLEKEANFCAIAAEPPFSNFREIAYDRVGQVFSAGPWLGRTVLRPVVEFAFLYVRRKYHMEMQDISPENAVATTTTPVFLIHGRSDSNIPVRHSRRIQSRNPRVVLWEVPGAEHCGAISAAPEEFEGRLIDWYQAHPLQR